MSGVYSVLELLDLRETCRDGFRPDSGDSRKSPWVANYNRNVNGPQSWCLLSCSARMVVFVALDSHCT